MEARLRLFIFNKCALSPLIFLLLCSRVCFGSLWRRVAAIEGSTIFESVETIPKDTPRYWDASKPISYAFNGNFTNHEKATVTEAVLLWSVGTCLRFEEVPYDPKRSSVINIERINRPNFGHTSPQDPKTLVTAMQLSEDFLHKRENLGAMTHEFGHAIGLSHQHQRPDRMVEVLMGNVKPSDQDQYSLLQGLTEGTPYDVTSIMHYSGVEFSKDERKLLTMLSKDPDQEGVMGNLQVPSFNDYKIVNLHYNCSELKCNKKPLSKPCRNHGYQDPNSCGQCLCPSGTGGTFCEKVEKSRGFNELQCGGLIDLASCTSTTLTLPNYPSGAYPFNASCTWVISSNACTLDIAFEETPRIQCYDNAADQCLDYVEIRSDFSRLDKPGKFSTIGRKIAVHGGLAMIRFQSFTDRRDKDYRGVGFKLVVHARCPNSCNKHHHHLSNCRITKSGYDVNFADFPFCDGVKPEPAMTRPVVNASLPLLAEPVFGHHVVHVPSSISSKFKHIFYNY